MKSLKIDKETFQKIKNGIQNMIISKNLELEKEEKICIENNHDNKLTIQITAKNVFNTLEDAIKIIPIQLLGNNKDEFKGKIAVYRIKYDNDSDIKTLIKDKKIFEIIDINTVEELKLGRSVCKVFKANLKPDNTAVILKIQYLPSRNSLYDEYQRLEWLYKKINTPKVYYMNEENDTKYLIMEKKKGLPAFKFNNIGYELGAELKKIHNISIENCKFNNNSVENLLKKCIENIDVIFPEIEKEYPNESKEDIIDFLYKNIPLDKVVVHGDFSLPNILVEEKKIYNFIDLGDVSVSSKYFDFYYFTRSLKINKKENMIYDFLKGYGIKKFDEKYLKWMNIIDKSLY